MKRVYYIIMMICGLVALAACRHDYPTYMAEDCNLNFSYYDHEGEVYDVEDVTDEMRTSHFSFIYSGEEVETDTLWFEVETMGDVMDYDRPIALEQVAVDTGSVENAVAGTHYVAFDDPSLATYYRIPADSVRAQIPVVVLRKDAALEEKEVLLRFRFKANDYFKPGYAGLDYRDVYITDRLSQPGNWESSGMAYYFGSYTQFKHLLMIEWTDEDWDEEYIEAFMEGDQAYIYYMQSWFPRKLQEEIEANGEEPYIDPETGKLVSFSN